MAHLHMQDVMYRLQFHLPEAQVMGVADPRTMIAITFQHHRSPQESQ